MWAFPKSAKQQRTDSERERNVILLGRTCALLGNRAAFEEQMGTICSLVRLARWKGM